MISVVMSTFNRAVYLKNSLEGYARCKVTEPFELVIIDDGSIDDTEALIQAWQGKLDITYIRPSKPSGLWRDCAMTINMGIRASRGGYVIATHPEVIPGVLSIQDMWDKQAEKQYNACKVYYLTPSDQAQLGLVNYHKSNLEVRKLPNFYSGTSPELRGAWDYSHEATDAHTEWQSWVFGGMTRMAWRWFGGLNEAPSWGTVDVDFKTRREILGIPTYTHMDMETIVIHQNHDVAQVGDTTFVPTPRNMDLAMANIPHYSSANDARLGLI